MGQKVHRKRQRYYRRNSKWKPIIGWIVAAAILIPATVWIAGRISGSHQPTSAVPDTSTTEAPVSATTAGTTAATPAETVSYRGFTMPYTALRDTAALAATCQKAVSAGFNCAVVELKNSDGHLYYDSQTEAARTAKAASADALTLSEVTVAFAEMQKAGISPIVKLFAFADATAPRTLADAKITCDGHPEWTWYDGDPQNGGKPWLNPYADAAQSYITSLAEELQTAGAAAILLDGVYFPPQTAQANFTAVGNASLSKEEVLRQFITRMQALSDKPVLLSCNVNAALGNTTVGYETNPLSLGAQIAVPVLQKNALGESVTVGGQKLPVSAYTLADTTAKILQHLQETATAHTVVMPQMDADKTVIAALRAQSEQISFLISNDSGSYDFAALS